MRTGSFFYREKSKTPIIRIYTERKRNMACDGVKKDSCPCTAACAFHGKCCECIANHAPDQFPACFFTKEGEATYDRSFEALLKDRKSK